MRKLLERTAWIRLLENISRLLPPSKGKWPAKQKYSKPQGVELQIRLTSTPDKADLAEPIERRIHEI